MSIGHISISTAQTVSKATGGGSISADFYNSSNYDSLSGPTIRETSAGQLVKGKSIILKAPDGFVWNPNAPVTDSVDPSGANKTQLDVSSPTLTDTTIKVTVLSESQSAGQGQGPGEVTFYGIQVQPADTTIPNSGKITNTGTTGPGGSTNYGDLKMVPGTRATINIETKSDGTGSEVLSQDLVAGNSITVYSISRDQFENFIKNINVGETGWQLINETGGVSETDLVPSSTARKATFSSNLVGSAQIEATLNEGNANPSGTITVIPDETDHLTITQQPSSQDTAGQTFGQQPVLELRDQYDNTVKDDDSRSVTATATDSDVSLKGTTTLTPSSGVITFTDLNIEKVDTTTLTFSSSGLSSMTSNSISIESAAPADLKWLVQPSNTVKGKKISPPVELQMKDTFGNDVPESDSTITIVQDSSGALKNPPYTATTDTQGISVFSNIQIDSKADTGAIKLDGIIENANMDSVESSEFLVITSDALAKFEITDPNDNPLDTVTAGQSFDSKIKALDGNGNLFDTYQDSVIMSSTNGNLSQGGGGTANFTNGVLSPHPVTITTAGDINLTVTHPTDDNITGKTSVPVVPASVFNDSTEVTADPTSITADGASTSTITVQLKDEFGNKLQSGGNEISMETDAGQLTDGTNTTDSLAATDNKDGTYTLDLQSSTNTDTATIQVYRAGTLISNNQTVAFTAGTLDDFAIRDTDSTAIDTQVAGTAFNIDVWAVDVNDNRITDFSASLTFSSNVGGISSGGSANISGGKLSSHSITVQEADSSVTLSVTDGSGVTGQSNSFLINAASPDISTSTVTASPRLLVNDGSSTSRITIVLKDAFKNRVYQDYLSDLELDTTRNIRNYNGGTPSLKGLVFNQSQGVYIDTLTSSSTLELVTLKGVFKGDTLSDIDSVEIVLPNRWTSKSSGPGDPDDWNEPDNWSLGSIPISSDFVIIPSNPANGTEFPVVNEDIVMGSLTIKSGANIQFSESQTATVENEATINGAMDIDAPSDIFFNGSLTGSGSFIADGDNVTEVKGDFSISSFTSAATGAIARMNGSQSQTLSSPDISIYELQIRNDVESTTDPILTNLDIDGDDTFLFPTGQQDTLDVVDITGNGRLELNDNRMLIRGNIDVQDLGTKNAKINFIDTVKQTIENFQEVGDLVIDNPSNVRVFGTNNMTVNGQLNLKQGLLELPSGVNLIANNKSVSGGSVRALREIPAPKGWRLLSAPLVSTFNDYLDGTITQGYTGAALSDTLQPNVLWYNEEVGGTDNQHWRAPADADNNLMAGRGYFVFFFGEVKNSSRYNDPLPDTLNIQGTAGAEFDGNSSFEFPVTYSNDADTADSAGAGWNMIGNPFAATIDWDDKGNWTKSNVDNVIYVWSPTDSVYKDWNGTSGSLGDGRIAPFQGFWVKANDSVATLSVSPGAKTTGRTFQNKRQQENQQPGFKLLLVDSDTTELNFSFTESGRRTKDRYDAYLLQPMTGQPQPMIYSVLPNGNKLSINNLPRHFGKPLKIPVGITSLQSKNAKSRMSVIGSQLERLPSDWEVQLKDRKTGRKISLTQHLDYQFSVSNSANKQKNGTRGTISSQTSGMHSPTGGDPRMERQKAKAQKPRFQLIIDPGDTNGEIPVEFALGSNYPNPFNPKTTIPYKIPVESHVLIDVYNVLGQHLMTLIDQRKKAGSHQIRRDFSNLSSGVYFYRLRADEKQFTKKMTLIK